MKATVTLPIGFIAAVILMLAFQKRLTPILKVGGEKGYVLGYGILLIVVGR